MNRKLLHIALDGPAGAGKSTVAKKVAQRLGISYLDTGAMYRAVAYKVLADGIPPEDEEKVSAVARRIKINFDHNTASGEQPEIYCDGENITRQIRSTEVSRAVSLIASYPEVRKRLVELQRREAAENSLIMDGRDIGTYVLPQAAVKIFLTASPEERARRRHLENLQMGKKSSLEEVLADIEKRDKFDSERKHAPLKPAADAIMLDTSGLTQEEVVERILQIIKEVGG